MPLLNKDTIDAILNYLFVQLLYFLYVLGETNINSERNQPLKMQDQNRIGQSVEALTKFANYPAACLLSKF